MNRGSTYLAALTAATLSLTSCSGSGDGPDANVGNARNRSYDVSAMSQAKELAPFSAPRLASGLVPPTNAWFSGLVFGPKPQPVFPLPISFTMGTNSFGLGLPQVQASEKSIVGSKQADVTLTIEGASAQKVVAYDDASVTIAASEGSGASGAEKGRTVVASGSPFVTHTAITDETLTSSVAWAQSGSAYQASTPSGTYGLVAEDAKVEGRTLRLAKGSSAVIFPVPQGKAVNELAQYANPVHETASSYSLEGSQATTILEYRTRNGKPTAFVANPVQRLGMGESSCSLGSYPTIFGRLELCGGTSLTWSVPKQKAVPGLDLSKLSDAQKATLRPMVSADIAALSSPPADTYYGGKWLYRTSQLMLLARGLGLTDDAKKAQDALSAQLVKWTEPKGCAERDAFCFVYDSTWKGMVGKTVTFGADAFNDHHFHYGYFLYAAGVLASVDPSVTEKIRPVMDLLAADIAAPSASKEFPRLRAYDVYASHSWASGVSAFADGNNQESSSEAVNAWAGLQLWGQATKQQELEDEGVWLMSSEAAAARELWVAPDLSDPRLKGYDKPFIGINWGNKRDGLTWFSPTAQAVLGIQLIPMSPSQRDYLAKVGNAGIDTGFSKATQDGGVTVPLGDYLLMYSALAGKTQADKALAQAKVLPDSAIDNGNSRSYLMAYLMSAGAS